MTADQYWEQDPMLTKYYRDAHNLTIETRNEELWLQGLYIYNAVAVVMANAMKKKGQSAQKYMDKPIRITPLTRAEKEHEKRINAQKTLDFFAQGQQGAVNDGTND
jgi:hypothetical protein